MKLDSLGLNHFVAGAATAHAVAPLSSALSSVHSRAQPPQSSSLMPRFFLYHSARAFSSVFALMNTPPIPVILAIFSFLSEINLCLLIGMQHFSRRRGSLRRFWPCLFS